MPDLCSDTRLQTLLDHPGGWGEAARAALLGHAAARLRALTRRMLRSYPDLRRWEETDDVFQAAMLRLHRALADVRPESAGHFLNLAAVQVRRTLLDLAKHHRAAVGDGANHHTDGQPADDPGGPLDQAPAAEPRDLDEWAAFHAAVGRLPEDEREVVGLLWYDGLTQGEAAGVLGVSVRTVKRHWHAARIRLHEALADG